MPAVELRLAMPDDAPSVAQVYITAFRATYEFPLAHDDESVRWWIREVLLPGHETWVALDGEQIVAFVALGAGAIEQLYVRPGWNGRGIGSALIALAKERRPQGLSLYTFQVNDGARRFYERHGFVAEWFGDGSENEERQPDVRYAWRAGGEHVSPPPPDRD